MTAKEFITTDPAELHEIAKNLHDKTGGLDRDSRQTLSRFLAGAKPACLPNERPEQVDFASSIVVARTNEVEAHLRTTHEIEELGPIVRDGVLPPYMYGPGLKLTTDRITDPLLQRVGCMPVCPAAAAQFVIELALLLEPDDVAELKRDGPAANAERIKQALVGSLPPADAKPLLKELFSGPAGSISDQKTQEKVDHTVALAAAVELADCLVQWKQEPTADPPADVLKHIRERLPYDMVDDTPLVYTCCALKTRVKSSGANDKIERADRIAAYLSAFVAGAGKTHVSGLIPWGVPDCQADSWIVQGAGDLSFNAWNVGIFREGSGDGARIVTVVPPGEPYTQRSYRCLVGWRKQTKESDLEYIRSYLKQHGGGALLGQSVAMLELKLAPQRVYLAKQLGDAAMDITKHVEFAIFGKSVLWDGEVVAKASVADQFRDVRHILALPFVGAPKAPPMIHAFGQEITADFYLLERALVSDDNLLRLACIAPISVALADLGVTKDLADEKLKCGGYVDRWQARNVRRAGDFAWEGSADMRLHIYLRPAAYPCSMIGLGHVPPAEHKGEKPAEINTLYALASGHGFKRGRFRIWEDCAPALRAVGARYALVLDEGEDVFQVHVRKGSFEAFDKAARDWDRIALAEHMPVPFPFDMVDLKPGDSSKHCYYRRTGMRASLAFGISLNRNAYSDDKPNGPST